MTHLISRNTTRRPRAFHTLFSALLLLPILATLSACDRTEDMLPVALGFGSADPSFRSPMAVAVIGGLITSTVLSLLVIPVVYTLIDDLENGLRKLPGLIRSKNLSGRKKAGFAMLALVLVYWLAFPFIPFLDIPNKIIVASVVAVVGEILFVLAVALLGKEYWGEIKKWLRGKIRKRRK